MYRQTKALYASLYVNIFGRDNKHELRDCNLTVCLCTDRHLLPLDSVMVHIGSQNLLTVGTDMLCVCVTNLVVHMHTFCEAIERAL